MIRKYENKDREAFQKICLETAPENLKSSPKKANFLLYRYCDYYIDNFPEFCFSLTGGNNEAVGYILCCPDSVKYKNEFVSKGEDCLSLTFWQKSGLKFDTKIYLPYYDKYPAHLHIDILPEYQHKGFGTELIFSLTNELSKHNINGVMLCVGEKNENAVNFYLKNNFTTIKKLPGSLLLGKLCNK